MGRAPCCEKMGLKKGPWTPEEDKILVSHIEMNGHSNWRALPKLAGLLRCGKSCRLRWINYLRPDIKRGNFTQEEEETIIKLHEMLGNRWSAIAARLSGRTDNEIKNVWHTHLKKKKLRNTPSNALHAKRQPRILAAKPETLNDDSANTPTSPLASSEGTSMSDLSTATADVSYIEIKSEEMGPIQIPVIDESFWSDHLDSFSVMGNNLLSDSSTYHFSAPIDEFEGMAPGILLSDSLINCFDGSPGRSGEENRGFGYDLLNRTVCVPEPELIVRRRGNGSTLLRGL